MAIYHPDDSVTVNGNCCWQLGSHIVKNMAFCKGIHVCSFFGEVTFPWMNLLMSDCQPDCLQVSWQICWLAYYYCFFHSLTLTEKFLMHVPLSIISLKVGRSFFNTTVLQCSWEVLGNFTFLLTHGLVFTSPSQLLTQCYVLSGQPCCNISTSFWEQGFRKL